MPSAGLAGTDNNILNSRLRYRFAPGGDLFVVLNHNADGENGFNARDTSLTFKLSYNFLL